MGRQGQHRRWAVLWWRRRRGRGRGDKPGAGGSLSAGHQHGCTACHPCDGATPAACLRPTHVMLRSCGLSSRNRRSKSAQMPAGGPRRRSVELGGKHSQQQVETPCVCMRTRPARRRQPSGAQRAAASPPRQRTVYRLVHSIEVLEGAAGLVGRGLQQDDGVLLRLQGTRRSSVGGGRRRERRKGEGDGRGRPEAWHRAAEGQHCPPVRTMLLDRVSRRRDGLCGCAEALVDQELSRRRRGSVADCWKTTGGSGARQEGLREGLASFLLPRPSMSPVGPLRPFHCADQPSCYPSRSSSPPKTFSAPCSARPSSGARRQDSADPPTPTHAV